MTFQEGGRKLVSALWVVLDYGMGPDEDLNLPELRQEFCDIVDYPRDTESLKLQRWQLRLLCDYVLHLKSLADKVSAETRMEMETLRAQVHALQGYTGYPKTLHHVDGRSMTVTSHDDAVRKIQAGEVHTRLPWGGWFESEGDRDRYRDYFFPTPAGVEP